MSTVVTSAPARLPDGSTALPGRSPEPPPGAVLGDGTTAASRARARWRRWRWPLLIIVILLAVVGISSVVRPPVSVVPLAPNNPDADGARAVAQILQRQGVRVDFVQSFAEAQAAAGPGTTLLVTATHNLLDEHLRKIAQTEADLVLVRPTSWALPLLAPEVRTDSVSSTQPRTAECTDPDAQAAESIRSRGAGLVAVDPSDPTVTICFPDRSGAGAYAVIDDGERRVTVLDDAVFRNEDLAEHGHAALALRALGRHDHLVWYVPHYTDLFSETDDGGSRPGLGALLPPWVTLVGLQLLLAAAVAALWRGRRLGRLVTEPLPVTVRSAEATVGRGTLYRAARSYGHAAAGLRAGTASRVAARLGLPRSAGAPQVIDAVVGATGRPAQEIAELLYGPPPTDDAGLLALARRLDHLESEVHRP